MAVFELTNDETVLFAGAAKFARGKNLHMHTNIQAIRTKRKDGGVDEFTIGADRRITVPDSNERALRHLRADPRFTEII
jgi:hypothetical protein